MALLTLLALFHLSLVLPVTVLTWSRALVIALHLAGIMGADLAEGSLGEAGPVVATAVLTVVALGGARWTFERQEL